jgi:hypothetical protein
MTKENLWRVLQSKWDNTWQKTLKKISGRMLRVVFAVIALEKNFYIDL